MKHKAFVIHLKQHTKEFHYLMVCGKNHFLCILIMLPNLKLMKLTYVIEVQLHMLIVNHGVHRIYNFFTKNVQKKSAQ